MARSQAYLDTGAAAWGRTKPEVRADRGGSFLHRDKTEPFLIDFGPVEADAVVLDAQVNGATVPELDLHEVCVCVTAGVRDGLAHDPKELLPLFGLDASPRLGLDVNPRTEPTGNGLDCLDQRDFERLVVLTAERLDRSP
jgi:hypothetical protein